MFLTIIIFIAFLSILILVHEWGHFITARKAGMRVEEFGFGFPPRLFGIRRGEVLYSFNFLPVGGFVRIFGEDGSHRNNARSFASKKKWQRGLVIIAGVS